MVRLGEKIKQLRKQKNISQEVLANHLGVSFQAVSKWETEATQPDVIMIPAIASFFGVSTDELFDFNIYEIEQRVDKIVDEHRQYLDTDVKKSEQIIRNGLKKYPGNESLLNCLINIISATDRADEAITIAKALIESTKSDEIRIDAWRIMAEAYKSKGDYLGEIYLEKGEPEKAKIQYTQAINVLKSFENDFETSYTHSKYDQKKIKELENKLNSV